LFPVVRWFAWTIPTIETCPWRNAIQTGAGI
jgi:hypothetical protein